MYSLVNVKFYSSLYSVDVSSVENEMQFYVYWFISVQFSFHIFVLLRAVVCSRMNSFFFICKIIINLSLIYYAVGSIKQLKNKIQSKIYTVQNKPKIYNTSEKKL